MVFVIKSNVVPSPTRACCMYNDVAFYSFICGFTCRMYIYFILYFLMIQTIATKSVLDRQSIDTDFHFL